MKSHLFILLLLAVLCSCKKKDETVTTPPGSLSTVIMPLKTGNYWVYVDSNFSKGPLVISDTSRVSITGSKVISVAGVSHTVFLWTLTRNGYQGASCSWFAENLADGLNFFGGTNGQQDFIFSNVLEWKYPVVAGDSWTCADINFTATDSTFYQGLALERSCISPNSLFNTPAGAFNCIEYKYNLNFPQKTGMTSSGIFEPAGTGLYPDFESVFFKPDLGYLGFIIKDNGVMTAKRYLVSWHLN